MKRWINPGGVIVALVGFGVTRFFVAESVRLGDTVPYLLGGIAPMVIGLGVTVYGVALALGPFSNEYVWTVARWCILGTGAMIGVLVVTSADPLVRGEGLQSVSRSGLLVTNVVLGGTVGGVLIGIKSARNTRQRQEIRRQANRVLLLDRMLRHEVINAATIIDGHAELLATTNSVREASVTEIRDASRRIVKTIDVVGELTDEDGVHSGTDVTAALSSVVDAIEPRHPEVTIHVDDTDDTALVAADHAQLVYQELLENAAEHASSKVTVDVTVHPGEVGVTISDDGPGLPEAQRRLLLSGEFPEYDDPTAGFGLQIVRLLVVRSEGSIAVDDGIDGAGQSITITFPRAGGQRDPDTPIPVTSSNLSRAIVAGLLSGLAMGGLFAATTEVLPVIGSLYGVANPVVGWVTHLFHSVVFALVFAAGCSHPSVRTVVHGPVRGTMAAVAWGLVLWLVAAGVVMPLWLQVVGVPAPLPNLPRLGFLSHVLWGTVLGGSYAVLGRFDTDQSWKSMAINELDT